LAYGGGIISNLKSNLSKIQIPLFLFSELLYTFFIVFKEKIDVINSHWLLPQGLVGAICRKIMGTRHVLTVHAAGLFAIERLPFKAKISSFITKNSDKIIVVSTYIGKRLIDLIPIDLKEEVNHKIIISPMGIPMQKYKNISGNKRHLKLKYGISSDFTLLFIGRLSEKKGVSYLIEAISNIILHFDVTLIICGDGPLRNKLEKIVKKKRLEKYVRFAGYVSISEKVDYLFLSDILIVPSIVTEKGDTEGLPVVVLEGMVSGIPIIVSDVSGISDVIKNGYNGYLIEQKNPKKIAEKVMFLLKNKELRIKFSENALKESKKYDWDLITKKYINIFTEIMSNI
jgi:glycosyltransferase involved in cell wall biosynthesis